MLDRGRESYQDTWELQKDLVRRRTEGETDVDALILVEHDHVITLGRKTTPENFKPQDIPVFKVERGGDATYHGPGQLVGYPIVRLATPNVQRFVRDLEEVLDPGDPELRHRVLKGRGAPGGLGRGTEGRVHRRRRDQLGHIPRVRPQREHRPLLLRADQAVRPRPREDNVDEADPREGSPFRGREGRGRLEVHERSSDTTSRQAKLVPPQA